MRLCLLDAWHPEDPALLNSHWVACRTEEALLRAFPGAALAIVSGGEVTPDAVATKLGESHEGYAYFGHGNANALCGVPEPDGAPVVLLARSHVGRIGASWFHAFACMSGETLARDAASAGVSAYLGYRVKVILEWEPERLPAELLVLLQDLVTEATLSLAGGERSPDTIRRRVRTASDRLLEWMDTNEEATGSLAWTVNAGLQMLANLLHKDLVLEGAEIRE
jgi:hypothetical protein